MVREQELGDLLRSGLHGWLSDGAFGGRSRSSSSRQTMNIHLGDEVGLKGDSRAWIVSGLSLAVGTHLPIARIFTREPGSDPRNREVPRADLRPIEPAPETAA